MAKATNSYEMVKWIPFDRETPADKEEVIVFSKHRGVLFAEVRGDYLQAYDHRGNLVSGSFSHWAKPLKGPKSKQLWIDWAVSWVK